MRQLSLGVVLGVCLTVCVGASFQTPWQVAAPVVTSAIGNPDPITDATAVRFANEEIRPLADQMAQLYYRASATVDRWNALGGTSLIPNTSDTIDDGADVDGRPVITGANAVNLITRLTEYTADMEASSNSKLNTVLACAVNPTR